jgi:site-specific DNA-methyltransferase (adenine-specific)
VATRTRAFGAGNRESHDATPFYERFTAPELSDDDTVNTCGAADSLICGDARDMRAVDDCSVALVVTSPPYFAGKEYEAALGEGHVPGSYLEYLAMLRDVFAECRRVLEPGGRMARSSGRRPAVRRDPSPSAPTCRPRTPSCVT